MPATLDMTTFQMVEQKGPKPSFVDGMVGVRVDNKNRSIMLLAEPSIDFNGANFDEVVHVTFKVDNPEGLERIAVRLELDTTPNYGVDEPHNANWGEWDLDIWGYTGDWITYDKQIHKQPFQKQGWGGLPLPENQKWRWIGITFELNNVGGRGDNVFLSDVAVGIP
ncbi:MAG: hypothetical protein ACXAEN_20420 [Candidatus Thorarchaeota archaeon]|jgi:hypothetical protein